MRWFKKVFLRFTSGSTVGLTGKGIIYGYIAGFIVLSFIAHYVVKTANTWLDKRDESRKVEAVIDSNNQTVENIEDFNKGVKDDLKKVGSDDIFDIIN